MPLLSVYISQNVWLVLTKSNVQKGQTFISTLKILTNQLVYIHYININAPTPLGLRNQLQCAPIKDPKARPWEWLWIRR